METVSRFLTPGQYQNLIWFYQCRADSECSSEASDDEDDDKACLLIIFYNLLIFLI